MRDAHGCYPGSGGAESHDLAVRSGGAARDTSKLSAGDQKALAKLLEAARVIDDIFLKQAWSGNVALRAKLAADSSALGKARLHYFELNKGPWSELDDHAAFLPGVPEKKLPGANFYPEDMTKQAFESDRWVKG